MTPRGEYNDHITILHHSAAFLRGRGRNDSSQFGEDGLVEALFEWIGEANRWCFEVGAADGVFYSNTKRLYESGWDTVLIEACPEQYKVLNKLSSSTIRTVNEEIGPDSLDRILSDAGAPEDLDFGVIDIDGQDYWFWKGMRRHKPRVMLVEYSRSVSDYTPLLGGSGQATFSAMFNLGTELGYVPVVRTYVNILCVREDAWGGK